MSTQEILEHELVVEPAKTGLRTINQQTERDVVSERTFYGKDHYFSYSAISKLLSSPSAFYTHYILKKKEDKPDKYLLEGKLIHCFLLDEKAFDKDYIVMDGTLPSENTKFVIDQVFKKFMEGTPGPDDYPKLDDYKDHIMEILVKRDLHQSLKDDKLTKKQIEEGVTIKTGDQKRMEKICTTDAVSYWDFKLLARDKEIVDRETRDFCLEAAMTIANIVEIRQILGMEVNESDDVEVFNEKYFRHKDEGELYGFHGFLDNLVIDHDNEVIRINDFKTTGKELQDFKWTIENFKYWIQAIIYKGLIQVHFKNLFDKGYQLEIRFIVVDKNGLCYPFVVSNSTLEKWFLRFTEEILPKLDYHYKKNEYCLPYELAAHPQLL